MREIPAEVADLLLMAAGNLFVTYDKMALLVAKRFGPELTLTAGEIATFLGRAKKGIGSLNQLHRDREVADWLRQNMATGSLKQVRAACIAHFGPDRVPSQTATSEFLRREGRGKKRRGDVTFLSDKPDVAAWLLEAQAGRTLDDLRRECAARFGKDRTPSQSGLHRFFMARLNTRRVLRKGVWTDLEVGDWLRENAPRFRLADLHALCVERFGAERAGSATTMYRFLAAQNGPKLTRKKSRVELAPGLAELSARQTDHANDGSPTGTALRLL